MRNSLLISIFLVFLSTAASAQVPSPSPSPTPVDNDVVKISTTLIQVDVTVTDRKGKPITDLKPEDVEIYENGKKQKITNFSFVSSGRPVGAKTDTKTGSKSTDPGFQLPPPPVRPENVRRTMAIVVDDLTMSFESVPTTRDAVRTFVREQMQEGDLVAILRTGTGIGLLQQFTTDKRLLLAAADKIRFNMSGGARVGIFNPFVATLDERVIGTQSASGLPRDRHESEKLDTEINNLRQSIFITGTLGAINYIIRGMKDLPGRKSITLISDGIRLFTRDSGGGITGPQTLDSLRSLTDLANRASVVIYAIDARGLAVAGLTAEDDVAGLSSAGLEQRLSSRRDELIDTQTGLQYLAKQTGGFAVVNQNAINRGLQRVIDDQNYYLVGFEPNQETFDPRKNRFNKLEVKVLRKDAKVRYRSGFYAIADEKIAELTRTSSTPLQALYDALTSPFGVNDISLRLNALFMVGDRRSTELRSYLHADARGLTFVKDPATGKHKTTFDLVTYTFVDNGKPLDGKQGTISVTLSDEGYRLMQERGFVYNFVVPIKKAGAYQVRVAIRDTATNKTGSAYQFVEIPNIKKDRLALSGVVLGNIGIADVSKLRDMTSEAALKAINPVSNTAIRQFRPGSLLTYEMTVYNPKLDPMGAVDLSVQARVFSERQLIFDGQPTKLREQLQTAGEIPWQGSLELGPGLRPGNYTLQLIVTDNNVRGTGKIASQFVPYEIVDK